MSLNRFTDQAIERSHARALTAIVGMGAICTGAQAQFETGFELPEYIASASGTVLTAQQAWYLPNTTSTDWSAFTYNGNTLGLPQNPQGGDQFAAATGPAGSTFGRAQMDVVLGAGTWSLVTDVAVNFQGTLPTAQNIGSMSMQPGGASARLIMLATWTSTATADSWNADIVYYNAAGTSVSGPVPDTGFQNLDINHWYRWSTTFDFTSNRIGEVTIEDLTTGVVVTHTPSDWYLEGGSAGTLPVPTAIRMFAGSSSVVGNTLAFDNVSITPEASCYADCDTSTGVGVLDIFDFLCFQDSFVNGNTYACDCDTSTGIGVCDIFDFLCFQDAFVGGCP